MSLNNLTAVLNDKGEITISDAASGEALWYSGQNYGVMFAPATNTTFTGTAMFRSNEYSDTSKRPQFYITYRDIHQRTCKPEAFRL